MLLRDLTRAEGARMEVHLAALARHCRSQRFQRKVSESLRILEEWALACRKPTISCGGGKDSTAVLLLAMRLGLDVPVYRADPPNPLPDRPGYVDALARASGMEWRVVPYWWDVDAVLSGAEPYPALLKIRKLKEAYETDRVDGVALGLRSEESKGRMWLQRTKGSTYLAGRVMMCNPILRWSAEETVGFALSEDKLPLNPVYRKLRLAPELNRLRDGTWYPREIADGRGYREWLGLHYPEVICQYDAALRMMGRS